MTKPTDSFTWSTDTNQNTGPDQGSPTKTEPPAGFKSQGWISESPIFGQYLNWLLYVAGQWIDWLVKPDAAALNATAQTVVSSINTTQSKMSIFQGTTPGTVDVSNVVQPDTVDDDLTLEAGRYEVHCKIIASAASASEDYTFEINLNGSPTGIKDVVRGDGSDLVWNPSMSGILVVATDDVVDVRVAMATLSGQSVTVEAGSRLWARRIS